MYIFIMSDVYTYIYIYICMYVFPIGFSLLFMHTIYTLYIYICVHVYGYLGRDTDNLYEPSPDRCLRGCL